MDKIEIEILEDGIISVKTEGMSQKNHMSADELLFEIVLGMGGVREEEKLEHPFWHKRTVKRGGKIVRVK